VLLPSHAPLWIIVLPLALLWIVVFPLQRRSISLCPLCTTYASTKCYSKTLSSSNSAMNIRSTNVAPSLLLHTNIFCLCVKTQLHIFLSYLYHELSST
jgi:beta-lactamase regulating signal transducer with metallopeptidase domain